MGDPQNVEVLLEAAGPAELSEADQAQGFRRRSLARWDRVGKHRSAALARYNGNIGASQCHDFLGGTPMRKIILAASALAILTGAGAVRPRSGR